MPELPEVQTIVDDLNKKIKGETIAGFWTDWKKSVKMPAEKPVSSADKFAREIKGRKILNASRIGKNI
jgi:formamidopyrimidine-DNA glycosylase